MIFKTAALAAIGLACVWGQSYAQDAGLPRLASLQGLVLVDHGDGFVAAGAGSPFRGGDRVTAAPGGFAKISYSDGCSVTVNSRTMATIDSASPCDGGPAPQLLKTADENSGQGSNDGDGVRVSPTGLVLGGLAALGVGIAVGVVIESQVHHNTSVGGQSVSP